MMTIKACNAECRDGMFAAERAFIDEGKRQERQMNTPCASNARQRTPDAHVPAAFVASAEYAQAAAR